MQENGYEFSGKTVEEAIAEGLNQLGLDRQKVEIEILSKGSRGIFGIGSEPARVRLTPSVPTTTADSPGAQPKAVAAKPAPHEAPSVQPPASKPRQVTVETGQAAPTEKPALQSQDIQAKKEVPIHTPQAPALDPTTDESTSGQPVTVAGEDEDELAAMAVEMLTELIGLMGFEAKIAASWQTADDDSNEQFLLLDIQGHDLGSLIGRRGETLASLQYLIRLMINQQVKQWKNIVVDVEQYKERRINQLTQLALRMADQVVASGRSISLEPMPANERRIVHLALRDHPSVYTQSSGEGDRRKVHIVAKS